MALAGVAVVGTTSSQSAVTNAGPLHDASQWQPAAPASTHRCSTHASVSDSELPILEALSLADMIRDLLWFTP